MSFAALVLAQMWDGDDHMGNGWWWAMGIGWLIFLALIVVLAFVLIRHFMQPGGAAGQQRRAAQDVLDDRFARGEIDEDEYRRRRDALRG